MKKPRLALTAGDPAGIGYEIACAFLLSPEAASYDVKLIAHRFAVEKTLRETFKTGESVPVDIIEPGEGEKFDYSYGVHSAECGAASMRYVERAVKGALKDEFDAVVTCPINKESVALAGYPFAGHTEYLAYLAGVPDVSMLLAGKRVKTILATTHLPIKKVSEELTCGKILTAVRNAAMAGKYFGAPIPRIAVCALNPHAGDGGVLGSEEETVIIPAIEEARAEGHDVYGPFPADTVFTRASTWDFIIAAYHDQGMIAVKMDSFGEAVNITLNLPFVRTSVDHGTAFDIAGKGVASASSLSRAVATAHAMVKNDRSARRV